MSLAHTSIMRPPRLSSVISPTPAVFSPRRQTCQDSACVGGMRQPGSRSPLQKLLMAAGVASMPSRALAQFVAPHKVTFASSDPSAAAAFAVRYLGATRLSGDDGKPGSFRVKAECAAGGTACGDCVVGEWVAFRHTRLNMHDVPRGFVKLGFDRSSRTTYPHPNPDPDPHPHPNPDPNPIPNADPDPASAVSTCTS